MVTDAWSVQEKTEVLGRSVGGVVRPAQRHPKLAAVSKNVLVKTEFPGLRLGSKDFALQNPQV